jgi:hypothetical protein
MERGVGSFVGIASAALIALGITFASEVLQESIAPAAASVGQTAAGPAYDIDRTLKGDRLPVIVRPEASEPADAQLPRTQVPAKPRLREGCESAVSIIIRSASPQAGRCLT